jgi:DNA-directed RNA polymerase specialized sigma24 family protein
MAGSMSNQPPSSKEPSEGGSVNAEKQFTDFVATYEERLRRAFVAAYGGDRGREATAEALAFAWENWSRVAQMTNAPGYLYRVGQSRTRQKRQALSFVPPPAGESVFEPKLIPALMQLTVNQRTAVVLVHGYGWTLREVGDLTGVKVTTVQNHLNRGLAKMRRKLNGDIQ